MAAIWPLSRSQLIRDRDPIVGGQVGFFLTGTSTPMPVYTDPNLSVPFDNEALETNSIGMWPIVYLDPAFGSYRHRVVDQNATVLFDDDDISIPRDADYVDPDAGETSTELLAATGDIKARYGAGAHTGWVRCGGRTIGSAASGASERANADCEDLFEFLWNADANLTVSGGRGSNAAADWAADKTIALPDLRDRAMIGLGDMGNSDAARIADALVDGDGTNTTLGATVGTSTHELTEAELPEITPTGTFTGEALAGHTHSIGALTANSGGGGSYTTGNGSADSGTTGSTSAGTPAGTITMDAFGDGDAHPNMQPSMFVTFYIKL